MSIARFVALTSMALLMAPTAAMADIKVGYVDLQRALGEVEEGKNAQNRLKGILDSKQRELDKEQEGLRKEKEALEKQASAMSEETRNKRAADLQKKLFDLAQKWEKGKAEMATKQQEELQGIFRKMEAIIATIAQREQLTLVFEKSDSGLVYAPPSLELTNELVRVYNDKHKPGGKGAATVAKDAPKK
ncbi:MAG: OmpH family outer membrane protein [Myxococcaceae bacterium]